MNISGLFPIPIGMTNIGRDLTKKELKFIKDQSTYQNQGNTTSNDNYIFENKELADVFLFCQSQLEQFAQQVYAPKHNVEVYITQSWANYTKPGQFHHRHRHPNSWISGVFYVNADKENDKIFFYKDGYNQIDLPPSDWNQWNSKSWWFEAETGGLILFPSSLEHMVQCVTAENERISIAFNTFLKGAVGDNKELTELKLGI
jgi:uncharacterized protein (TIGR02466 family)